MRSLHDLAGLRQLLWHSESLVTLVLWTLLAFSDLRDAVDLCWAVVWVSPWQLLDITRPYTDDWKRHEPTLCSEKNRKGHVGI